MVLSGSVFSPNTPANGITINMHSVEYYFQWHLSQYSDSLDAGPYANCFLAEATDLLPIQNIIPAMGPIWPLQWSIVDPSPALKELIHEAGHLFLFSSEVAD